MPRGLLPHFSGGSRPNAPNNTYLAQNVPYANVASADVATGTTTSAYAAAEAGVLAVSVAGYLVKAGEFVNVAGNDQPTWNTVADAGPTNTDAVTLNEALKYAVESGAVVTVYKAATVVGAQAAGYDEQIQVSHTSGKAPQVGQMLAFGTGGSRHTYTIIEVDTVDAANTKVMLDRPLDAAIANADDAFPGPAGALNLALHREAIGPGHPPAGRPGRRDGRPQRCRRVQRHRHSVQLESVPDGRPAKTGTPDRRRSEVWSLDRYPES